MYILDQWSLNILVPVTTFVEYNFSTDQVRDGYNFTHSPAAHLQLRSPIPNRPWMGARPPALDRLQPIFFCLLPPDREHVVFKLLP